MNKLIISAFKNILSLDVRVIPLPDDDIDMGIFIIHDERTAKMDDKELSEFAFDFAITRIDSSSKEWLYMVTKFTDGVIRNGEVVSPPDSDYFESPSTYSSAENALQVLIIEIVKEKFNNLLMCREENEND